MPSKPLSDNRSFKALWISQALSEFAVEVLAIVMPLLVLTSSGSPAQAGLAASLLATATMVAALPAGILADRVDRKSLVLVAQTARVVCIGVLLVAVLTGFVSLWVLAIIAVVEGILVSIFDPAEQAALADVVESEHLDSAVSKNVVRPFLAGLTAPAVAGLMFDVSPAAPVVLVVTVLLLSVIALSLLRLPPAVRRRGMSPDKRVTAMTRDLSRSLIGGLSAVFSHRSRGGALVWILMNNTALHALVIMVVASTHLRGLPASATGIAMTGLGLGGVIGSLLTETLLTRLRPRGVLAGFTWILATVVVTLPWVAQPWAVAMLMCAATLFAPAANASILVFLLRSVRADMRGRVSSVVGLVGGGSAVLGPLLGGLALSQMGGRTALLAGGGALVAVAVGTLWSRSLGFDMEDGARSGASETVDVE